MGTGSPLARLQQALLASWFAPAPSLLTVLLAPAAALYGLLQRRSRLARERLARQSAQPDRDVLVVGNLIVGGAGKTPTTLALLQALRQAGRTPGVVSRGHGRQGGDVVEVTADADPARVGDEPLLIHRRGACPVMVGIDRLLAAQALLQAHPQVDVIVSDDGLQHRQLRRDVEVIVFDERGLGNGRLLPAGPLREPCPAAPPADALVLYNSPKPSTPWGGSCAVRRLGPAWPLSQWLSGQGDPTPLASLQGHRLLAVAGIAVPERFFAGLESAGLTIDRLPLADHHPFATAPWPTATRELITTEKDAVKLARWAESELTIWVVGLDLQLPPDFVSELLARLAATGRSASPSFAPKGRP